MTNLNFIPYTPLAPFPDELSDPYFWIPIKKMSRSQFEAFLCWLFKQLGYKVTRMKKTHDWGGDILLERFGEIIIIQEKHRKEHTGTSALQEVFYAKKKKITARPKPESLVSVHSP